uniref:Uncharacterized protein n=1 Tax=Melopsittacus undulatus TaxID=13146 RepID=A0A8C6J5V9_MELUD
MQSKLLCRYFSVCVAGLVGGNRQKQSLTDVSATAGQRVVLPCQSTIEDSDSSVNFFWYRQLPGEALKFLIKYLKIQGMTSSAMASSLWWSTKIKHTMQGILLCAAYG